MSPAIASTLVEPFITQVRGVFFTQLAAATSFDALLAEAHAAQKAAEGEPIENLDHLKSVAGEYEKLLLERGYIESRPEDEGGTGANYILTARGSRLLSLIDSSIPGNDHPRQVLDEQDDALDEMTFDEVASKAQIA